MKRGAKPTPAPVTRDRAPRVVDAHAVAIESRSLTWAHDENARKAHEAVERVSRFVDSAKTDAREGRPTSSNDWRNLFAVVAAGLEAATRREALDDARAKFAYATEELEPECNG